MELEDKKIYFVMSPHINYYHSFRGDSEGSDGFGLDLSIMESILDLLENCESQGLCGGTSKMTWDYADTFWSIQLQQKYQPDILKRIQDRCKSGKDEVLACSWSNSCQPMFNIEEMQKHTEWTFSNSLGLGMEDLFPGRVAPYMRPQEAMFTQGMIEPLKQGGVEGLLVYHSAGPFETSRAFLNPRLNLNQRYGLLNFKSTESDESMLMIPTYGFIDIVDHFSIKKYFQHIRHYQRKGKIDGHALVVVNFDMDSYVWKGIKLPKLLKWMPNSRGIPELLEAVDKFKYVELASLIDIIPKLKPKGEVTLRPDVADGNFNGYHNWAQKYNNTRMWTLEQQSRWMKCAAETISSQEPEIVQKKIDALIRGKDLNTETFLKNKMLLTSTTNFGMSMPFVHPDRQKTTMIYGTRMFNAANSALSEASVKLVKDIEKNEYDVCIVPITKRGVTEKESAPIISNLLIQINVPFTEDGNPHPVLQISKKYYDLNYVKNEVEPSSIVELILPPDIFAKNSRIFGEIKFRKAKVKKKLSKDLEATRAILKNKFITINFDILGKIASVYHKEDEFLSGPCFETAVTYGDKKAKRKEPSRNAIYVLKDGTDGFCASVRTVGAFKIAENAIVRTIKIITLYRDLPYLFIKTHVYLPKTFGSSTTATRGVYTVNTEFDKNWLEVMPLEIEPAIFGNGTKDPLRIWKHNFMGATNYFDLDMVQINPRNSNIDCLVSNISDGWMGVTNQEQGLVIGFNALKCANFSFSPIKLREKGFGTTDQKRQQIRINPFGTYWGKQLHYWSDPKASGFGQEIATQFGGTFSSSAPTFNGKQMEFDLVLAPYKGNEPPKSVQSFMNHFSLPPLILCKDKEKKITTNYEWMKDSK
ncbi:MAG: hypothetical protein ACTSRD_05820 [Promethearchaeota archaeon]